MLLTRCHSFNTFLPNLKNRLIRLISTEGHHVKIQGRKRFYKEVSVNPVLSVDNRPLFGISLDGRPLKTPGRKDLYLESEELAMIVAAEWDGQMQAKGIQPASMPLMSLVATALDEVSQDRNKVIETCMSYLATDTACYLSDLESDDVLRKRQFDGFTPLHNWLKTDFGVIVNFAQSSTDICLHPRDSVNFIHNLLLSLTDSQSSLLSLTALQSLTMECKSLIIALALACRQISPKRASELCRLEETYNIELWGSIPGHHDFDIVNGTSRVDAASLCLLLTHHGKRLF